MADAGEGGPLGLEVRRRRWSRSARRRCAHRGRRAAPARARRGRCAAPRRRSDGMARARLVRAAGDADRRARVAEARGEDFGGRSLRIVPRDRGDESVRAHDTERLRAGRARGWHWRARCRPRREAVREHLLRVPVRRPSLGQQLPLRVDDRRHLPCAPAAQDDIGPQTAPVARCGPEGAPHLRLHEHVGRCRPTEERRDVRLPKTVRARPPRPPAPPPARATPPTDQEPDDALAHGAHEPCCTTASTW